MYGDRILEKGLTGDDVQELQIRLAGFAGGDPDGEFGPGTEKQVTQFQRDYMKIDPIGVVDADTFKAIDRFSDQFPIDFEKLKCECGKCGGFGQGLCKGEYREGKPQEEWYYLYEYPGIHRMILWAYRAADFYYPQNKFLITCGYRCTIRNEQKGRNTTNHRGKAIDFDVLLQPGEDKKDDMNRCEAIRQDTVVKANAQIGWDQKNRKSFEPKEIAPTWIHYDTRMYESKYLEDRFFCKNLEELNGTRFNKLENGESFVVDPPKFIGEIPERKDLPLNKSGQSTDRSLLGILLGIIASILGKKQ